MEIRIQKATPCTHRPNGMTKPQVKVPTLLWVDALWLGRGRHFYFTCGGPAAMNVYPPDRMHPNIRTVQLGARTSELIYGRPGVTPWPLTWIVGSYILSCPPRGLGA